MSIERPRAAPASLGGPWMTGAVTVLVAAGIAACIGLAIAFGLDATGALILVLVVALGALGVAAARRAGTGRVAPAHCERCDGLISVTAPYCKHCGTRVGEPT